MNSDFCTTCTSQNSINYKHRFSKISRKINNFIVFNKHLYNNTTYPSSLIIRVYYISIIMFEIIVIVGDKLPYLDRNELLESSFKYLLHGLSVIFFLCRVSLVYALGRAPLFCFLLFKQKIHISPCLFSRWIFFLVFIFYNMIFTLLRSVVIRLYMTYTVPIYVCFEKRKPGICGNMRYLINDCQKSKR